MMKLLTSSAVSLMLLLATAMVSVHGRCGTNRWCFDFDSSWSCNQARGCHWGASCSSSAFSTICVELCKSATWGSCSDLTSEGSCEDYSNCYWVPEPTPRPPTPSPPTRRPPTRRPPTAPRPAPRPAQSTSSTRESRRKGKDTARTAVLVILVVSLALISLFFINKIVKNNNESPPNSEDNGGDSSAAAAVAEVDTSRRMVGPIAHNQDQEKDTEVGNIDTMPTTITSSSEEEAVRTDVPDGLGGDSSVVNGIGDDGQDVEEAIS